MVMGQGHGRRVPGWWSSLSTCCFQQPHGRKTTQRAEQSAATPLSTGRLGIWRFRNAARARSGGCQSAATASCASLQRRMPLSVVAGGLQQRCRRCCRGKACTHRGPAHWRRGTVAFSFNLGLQAEMKRETAVLRCAGAPVGRGVLAQHLFDSIVCMRDALGMTTHRAGAIQRQNHSHRPHPLATTRRPSRRRPGPPSASQATGRGRSDGDGECGGRAVSSSLAGPGGRRGGLRRRRATRGSAVAAIRNVGLGWLARATAPWQLRGRCAQACRRGAARRDSPWPGARARDWLPGGARMCCLAAGRRGRQSRRPAQAVCVATARTRGLQHAPISRALSLSLSLPPVPAPVALCACVCRRPACCCAVAAQPGPETRAAPANRAARAPRLPQPAVCSTTARSRRRLPTHTLAAHELPQGPQYRRSNWQHHAAVASARAAFDPAGTALRPSAATRRAPWRQHD